MGTLRARPCHTGCQLALLLLLTLAFAAQSAFNASAFGCVPFEVEEGGLGISQCTIALDGDKTANGSRLLDRDPGRWSLGSSGNNAPVHLFNITLQLASCADLWALAERECTFIASRTWPIPGLAAGPGYLYYPRLSGATANAERLNITCPPEDWAALLAASAAANGSNSLTAGLAPCATATVSSGQELIAELERLQPGAARVLISLAANISVPATPTPQRAGPVPGDDDTQPLVILYRNVTLAGGLNGPTEVNLRGRRNVFGLLAGWQLLQRQGAQQLQVPGVGLVWRGRPVGVMADVTLVNNPPGPPSTWPLGLLGMFHYHSGVDRDGEAGLQLIGLRTTVVYLRGQLGYIGYWTARAASLNPEERTGAAWLLRVNTVPQPIPDADGSVAYYSRIGDYVLAMNFSISARTLLTQPRSTDFDLWSSAPAGLLSGGANSSGLTPAFQLAPSSFAVAGNASQLLVLLQESWSNGPRVIMLMRNITLIASEWPQAGAALSYNVTLAGPVAGDPVQLDTGGLPLARAADSSGGGPTVALLLQRLVVRGLAPPLLTADAADVAAAGVELTGSAALQAWRDGCLAAPSNGLRSNVTDPLRWEVLNCTVAMPAGSIELLRRYNDPTACTGSMGYADAINASPAEVAAAAAACAVLQSPSSLSGPLAALLRRLLAIGGQAVFTTPNATATAPGISFIVSTLGGLTLVDSQAVAAANTTAAEPDAACSVYSLLLALPLPVSSASSARRDVRVAAVAGGSAAGAAVAALCAAGAAVILIRRRRKPPPTAMQSVEKAQLPEGSSSPNVAVLVEGGERGTDGADGKGQTKGAAMLQTTVTYTGDTMSADDVKFSVSFVRDDVSNVSGRPAAGPTMAESVFLGALQQPPPPPPSGREAAAQARAAAAVPPVHRMLDKGSVPTVARLRSQEAQRAGSLGTGSSGPASSARGNLRSAVTDEIEAMMRKCQAITNEPSAQPKGRRMRLLGRGAHGAVYLGEWRGLPAAIKTMVLGADASANRREQLVREVALTMTLEHPHIVPTYHFDVGTVHAEESTPMSRLLASDQEVVVEGADEECDVVALRLKLVMQYCEGGTLRAALQTGRFSKPLEQTPRRSAVEAARQGAAAAAAAAVVAEAATATAATRSGEGTGTSQPSEPSDASAARAERVTVTAPISSPMMLSPEGSAALATVAPRRDRRLEWADIEAAPNLPLSLLAALDVLRGLEYLHGCGVIHGDLTENNVLLKAAQPVLPQPHPPPRQVQSTQRARLAQMRLGASAKAGALLGAAAGNTAAAAGARAYLPLGMRHAAQLDPTGGWQQQRAAGAQSPLAPRQAEQQQEEQQEQEELLHRELEGGYLVGQVDKPRPQSQPQQQLSCLPPGGSPRSGPTRAGSSAGRRDGSGSDNVEVSLAVNAQAAGQHADAAPPQATRQAGAEAAVVDVLPRLPSRLSLCANAHAAWGALPVPKEAVTEDKSPQALLSTHGSLGPPAGPFSFAWAPLAAEEVVLPEDNGAVMVAANQLLKFVFKIADFGLSVQLQAGSETHISNMAQGTPFFAAPEVVHFGRLSPAADIYSFGVLLWLLLHGVSLGQVRHLLPRIAYAPIAPMLLRHASRGLPPAAHYLLARSLALEPSQRPTAAGLRQMLEDVLRDVTGPSLAWALLAAERQEHVVSQAR